MSLWILRLAFFVFFISCNFESSEESREGGGLYINHKKVPNKFDVVPPATNTYTLGQNIDIRLSHPKVINVKGVPRIEITIGSQKRYAEYYSGEGTKNLIFRYQVVLNDLDLDGIELGNKILLNGGELTFTSGTKTSSVGLELDTVNTRHVYVETDEISLTIDALPQAINLSNVNNYSISGTCSVNGSDVSINVNAGELSATTTCAGSSWNHVFDLTAVSDSSTVDFLVGHETVTESISTFKDTVSPVLSFGALPTIDSSNVLSYVINGSCDEEGRNIQLGLGAISVNPTCSGGLFSVSIDASALVDGNLNVTAQLQDLAGNSTFITQQVLKDVGIPTININNPLDGSFINITSNTNSFSIDGACSEAGEIISVEVDSVAAISPSGFVCDGTNFSGTVDVISYPESTLVLTASISDSVGNTNTSDPVSLVKDITAPVLSVDPLSDITVSNVSSYNISGNCDEEGRTVNIAVGTLTDTALCSASVFSTTINTAAISDGNVDITISITDQALNYSEIQTSISKDTLVPTISILSPIDNDFINISTDSNTYTVSGNCSEAGELVSILIDNVNAPSQNGFICDGTNFSGSIDTTSLTDGSFDLSASISDSGGNTAESVALTIVKDTVAPILSLNPLGNINLLNASVFSISGTCSEDTVVNIQAGPVSDSGSCISGSFNESVNLTSVLDGGVSIEVGLIDIAGNPSGDILDSTQKDASAPTVSITSYSNITNANVSSYDLIGECSDDGEQVSIEVGGLSILTSCILQTWSVTFSDLTSLLDGQVTIQAQHVDSFGNVNTATINVDKNTSLPVVEITNFSNIDSSNVQIYKVSGNCSENGQVVDAWIGNLQYLLNCSSGIWSTGFVDVSSLSDGNVLITADHSDGAGANATQASETVIKNLVNPTVVISSAPNITAINNLNYMVSGTCSESNQNVDISIDTISLTVNCSNGSWSTGLLDVSSIPEGTITITADHSDGVGNNAQQESLTVNVDLTGVTVSNLAAGPALTNSISLAWEVDLNGNTLDDYKIQYRISGSSTWLNFDDGISSDLNSSVTNLNAGTEYEFRVSAQYNSTSFGPWSNISALATQPDSPLFSENTAMNVGGATSSRVVALEDSTNITLNGAALVTLNKGETHVFNSSQFDVISADGPIYTAGRLGNGSNTSKINITWSPTSWAGKSFSFNSIRNNPQNLFVYAIENAVVEVKQGNTVLDSVSVNAGSGASLSWSVYGSYQVNSTGTILAFHYSGSGNTRVDPKPLLPSANKIIGFPSSSMTLIADIDATNYTYVHSNSRFGINSLNNEDAINILPQGTSSLFQSESLVISADRKISGASYADSNGNCASIFLPTNLMKKKYAINSSADFVAFASLQAGTIQVLDSNDNVVDTLNLTRSGGDANAPYRARRGTSSAGLRFISTVPMAGWYQPDTDTGAADQDETILYGAD